MRNPGSTKQTGSGLSAQILVWGGVVMLIAGGLLTYPYINSRLTPSFQFIEVEVALDLLVAGLAATET